MVLPDRSRVYHADDYIGIDLLKKTDDMKPVKFNMSGFYTAGAYELLNKLILDFKSKLPPEERVYQKKDNASLIYNLFKGGYKFSYKQYKEVYDALCDCT